VKNKSLYICMIIFAGLTAVKITMPEHAIGMREKILSVIEGDDDYYHMVTALGEKLINGNLGEELMQAFNFLYDKDEKDVTNQAENTVVPEPTVILTDESVIEINEPDAIKSEVLPDNVSVSAPELPFEFCCPVAGIDSSGFGYRTHPVDGEYKFHYGTDFAANSGDEIIAFADGYVYAAGSNNSYGNYLILSHDGGFRTLYAHLSSFETTEGARVSKGELIGRVGQSGIATGPHLHFELLYNDTYINPEHYI